TGTTVWAYPNRNPAAFPIASSASPSGTSRNTTVTGRDSGSSPRSAEVREIVGARPSVCAAGDTDGNEWTAATTVVRAICETGAGGALDAPPRTIAKTGIQDIITAAP